MRPMPQPISTNERALVVVALEPELLQVDGHLAVAGGDELGERQRVPGLVVEDPARRLDDLVGAGLLLGDAPGDLPGDQLRSPAHPAKCGRGFRRPEFGAAIGGKLGRMSMTTDRALWESIVDSDAEVPPGHTAAELLPSLLDLLGENDPFLRDEVGYGVLARWVVQDQLLGADELRYAVERLVPDLRIGLDGDVADDQAVVRRSYSALALAILAYRDVEDHFLPRDEVHRLLDAAIAYLLDETDRRGHVPELGWINATAHAADLLKFLVRNPLTDESDHRRVLAALQDLLTRPEGPVFVDDEEDRLVLVVVDVHRPGDDQRRRAVRLDRRLRLVARRAGRGVRPGVAGRGGQPQALRAHAASRPVLAGAPPRAEVRQAGDHRPRHRPPVRRRPDLIGSVANLPVRSRQNGDQSGSDRLDDEDVARGVVGDVVGDGAEHPLHALHASVADDDDVGARSARPPAISASPGLPSTATDDGVDPLARKAAACCSAICSAVVRLDTVERVRPDLSIVAAPRPVKAHTTCTDPPVLAPARPPASPRPMPSPIRRCPPRTSCRNPLAGPAASVGSARRAQRRSGSGAA